MRKADFESSLDPQNEAFEEKGFGAIDEKEDELELYGFTIIDDDDVKDDDAGVFGKADEEDEKGLEEEGAFI